LKIHVKHNKLSSVIYGIKILFKKFDKRLINIFR